MKAKEDGVMVAMQHDNPEILKQKNQELHKDWNRMVALINEFSCGNNCTKASMYFFAWAVVSQVASELEELADRCDIPYTLQPILQLAAIDILRRQLNDNVTSTSQEEIEACLKKMKDSIAPAEKLN